MAEQGERRSFGGRVVESGLAAAGYRLPAPADVALVETARPMRAPFSAVLAQNAWNVISMSERQRRLTGYRPGQRGRFYARWALSRINLARAGQVVCLSEAMALMCRGSSSRVIVSPVTAPVDFFDHARAGSALPPGTMLVPGTVAPYKRPGEALSVFARDRDRLGLTSILFAGIDDGSGAWAAVTARAHREGVSVSRRTLDRSEMRACLESAATVAILSELESLSFSVAEALMVAADVTASPIAAHIEVAKRLGRQPRWWGATDDGEDCEPLSATAVNRLEERLRREWIDLGAALGLEEAR